MSVLYVCLRCRRRAFLQKFAPKKVSDRVRRGLTSQGLSAQPDGIGAWLSQELEVKKHASTQTKLHSRRSASPGSRPGGCTDSVNTKLVDIFESTQRKEPSLPLKPQYPNTTYGKPLKKAKRKLRVTLEKPDGPSNIQSRDLCGNIRPIYNDGDEVLLNDLRKAVKEGALKSVVQLWLRFLSKIQAGIRADDRVFAEFLITFFSLGSPTRAIEAWHTMSSHGCKPVGRHWVALIEGCKNNRDLASLKSIWQRLEVANIQRTNQMWTLYISGLLVCKDWTSALKAIQQMVGDWKSSPKKDPSDAGAQVANEVSGANEMDSLTPSIVPINAAISGLVAVNKSELADELLKWAITQNIKPDTTTFNTILRPAVRLDETDKVLRILQNMKTHACKPDVATFTLMLDGLVRNPNSAFRTASPSSQQEIIDSILQDMKDNSIKPNERTYSVIIDALLNPKNHNLTAAHAILARMDAEEVKPTSHIYTRLISHYFSTDPPSIHAIDNLWHRILQDRTPLDNVFYDRMIEGYARMGAVDKMLRFLRKMTAAGKGPGWLALLEALHTLVKAGEWELAENLVRGVESERGHGKFGLRGGRGREEFWAVVREYKGRGMFDAGRR